MNKTIISLARKENNNYEIRKDKTPVCIWKNLLKDYEKVVYKLEALLVQVTGNMLSKSTYPLEVMLSESIRHTEELVDEAVEKTKRKFGDR